MDMSSENDEHRIMEGWLYLIRSNKFGFQYSRKRYYVLQNHDLKSFCSVSHSLHKYPSNISIVSCHFRSNNSGRVHDTNSVDYHLSLASITDPKTADLSSYWTIFGCHNGKHKKFQIVSHNL
ncbi:hypothetical protein Ccrd_021564 [Cynara cardunculus var. scolymus]|uniref:PH domain-containing protein n=1 Tax=Cynara cardunculus var. scolymus TaxID=59895 RepID=A0A103Y0B8_CYNCS|nr:hypothetical protein Ccrd_021564 [Cynara cardunculus var. scolymus]